MANLMGLHAVGESVATFLRRAYPEALQQAHSCTFSLVSSGELAADTEPDNALTLFLYRVTHNEHARNLSRRDALGQPARGLRLDLHYLLTAWFKNALSEQVVLAWAIEQLHRHPVLDRSVLSPQAGWREGEAVQLVPAELSHEEMFRIWDKLDPSYRLSVGYIARVIEIEPAVEPPARPVVAARFGYMPREEEP